MSQGSNELPGSCYMYINRPDGAGFAHAKATGRIPLKKRTSQSKGKADFSSGPVAVKLKGNLEPAAVSIRQPQTTSIPRSSKQYYKLPLKRHENEPDNIISNTSVDRPSDRVLRLSRLINKF